MTAISPLQQQHFSLAIPPQMAAALVTEVAEGGVVIAQPDGACFARVALSCLIQPEPGDEVMTSLLGDVLWVTAILARNAAAPVRLLFPGDASISAPNGCLSLSGAALDVTAGQARLAVEETEHVGRSVTSHVASFRVIASFIETLAEHLLLRARRSFRTVEQIDQLRCATLDHAATGTLNLRGENAFITAANAVRVDASQIHMG